MTAPLYGKTHESSKPEEDCASSPREVRFLCPTVSLAKDLSETEAQKGPVSTGIPHDSLTSGEPNLSELPRPNCAICFGEGCLDHYETCWACGGSGVAP